MQKINKIRFEQKIDHTISFNLANRFFLEKCTFLGSVDRTVKQDLE